jgi:hypothetical protein
VLLVCDQGWNRAVLDAMTVPDASPGAGENDLDIYRVQIYKRRRPARSRYTWASLVDDGPSSPGRLMRQAIEATEPARIAMAMRGEPAGALLAAACTDSRNSPFSPPGLPCTASFLACLGCRNAVATRRHLPRLAYLHQALDELRATVDTAVWDQDWRSHFLRLTALLDESTTTAECTAAARAISDADRGLSDRLLAGGYAS